MRRPTGHWFVTISFRECGVRSGVHVRACVRATNLCKAYLTPEFFPPLAFATSVHGSVQRASWNKISSPRRIAPIGVCSPETLQYVNASNKSELARILYSYYFYNPRKCRVVSMPTLHKCIVTRLPQTTYLIQDRKASIKTLALSQNTKLCIGMCNLLQTQVQQQ